MAGIYGCGCKEVYRLPHITYPYSSCICSFLQQHPYFLFIFLMFFVLVCIYKYTNKHDFSSSLQCFRVTMLIIYDFICTLCIYLRPFIHHLKSI